MIAITDDNYNIIGGAVISAVCAAYGIDAQQLRRKIRTRHWVNEVEKRKGRTDATIILAKCTAAYYMREEGLKYNYVADMLDVGFETARRLLNAYAELKEKDCGIKSIYLEGVLHD
jgi:transposase-like protein